MDSNNYIDDIKLLLARARQRAYTAINSAMVEVYWQIGRRIVEEVEQISYALRSQLTAEFGKGFLYANLKNFKQFYLTYPEEQICYTLCSKLTWSHNRLIMRVQNESARQYYLQEASEQQSYMPTEAELIAEIEREKRMLNEKYGREQV
ncbi:MAG: DUF1016 N-terminal domain-containing protein [Prevotellaceae bacterium]|jgi:hypothetical protein|nr:DUF1016 N-terminal domain-containing protein [Prevotellaceae bacterium]